MKPVLVKKALPRHWSKDFDTTEDLRNVLRQARLMSLEDAKNIENIPLRPEIRDWELEQTAEGMKSIVPGIQGGKITDQGYVDEGGAFTYPAQLQSFLPLIHPEARMSGVTMPDIPGSMGKPSGRPSVLVGSFEKPEFHATQKEGRVQTEGFMPGGFDPSQAVLLTEPSRAFARQEVPMAIQNLVGGKMKDYAPNTYGYNEPVGRAMESFNILPHSAENPLLQYSGWGKPRTVDDEFRLSEPMDIAFQLLKQSLELQPPMTQGVEEEQPVEEETPMVDVSMGSYKTPCECAEEIRNEAIRHIQHGKERRSDFAEHSENMEWYDNHYLNLLGTIEEWQTMSCEEILQWVETAPHHYQEILEQCQSGMNEADQMKYTGEPMDIAMRLLKNEPADYADTYQQVRNNIDADGKHMTDEELNAIDERYSELHDDESHLGEYYNLLEAIELEKKRRAEGSFDGIGHNEETGFTRSEPMDIALQLLKERVSPEAKRHKLEYDKKYESSPERVKYREDLNRERRRRGIYGSHNHQDVSHTEGGKLTLESEHENRARHFKDKGTLREL